MKTNRIFIIIAILGTVALTAFIKAKPLPGNSKGFAVVELFTSEGCSSCPPADELVTRIQKEYHDQPVYVLAFHVDYWNRLGWKDVFSSAEYSDRQEAYARYLHISSVYTPQIVVNGTREFVGSEEGTLRGALRSALQKTSAAQLTLSALKTVDNKIKVHYQVGGNDNNAVLLLALVQKTAQTHVKAGENDGRTLSHVQIVKQLESIRLGNLKIGERSITFPAGFNLQNGEIIGLLQNTATGEITGAGKAEFMPGI